MYVSYGPFTPTGSRWRFVQEGIARSGGPAIRGMALRRRYGAGVQRSCARPGCSSPSTTTLSYHYASRTVWLEDLHPDAHPANHDLCPRHAARMTPPNGWELVDRRGRKAASPAADDERVERVG